MHVGVSSRRTDFTRPSRALSRPGRHDHVELIGAYSGRADVGVAQLAGGSPTGVTGSRKCHSWARGSGVLAEALRERGVPKPMIHIEVPAKYFGATSMFLDAVREKH